VDDPPILVRQVPAALALPSFSISGRWSYRSPPAFLSLIISSMVSAYAEAKDISAQVEDDQCQSFHNIFPFFTFPRCSKAPNEVEALAFQVLYY